MEGNVIVKTDPATDNYFMRTEAQLTVIESLQNVWVYDDGKLAIQNFVEFATLY